MRGAVRRGTRAHYGIIASAVLKDELGPWMERRQWDLDDEVLSRLTILLEHWQRYGAVMNLSGDLGRPALLAQIRDGLDTAYLVRSHVEIGPKTRWVDVGSGGGFPGLVIGAALPVRMQLVEPREKRVAFLRLAVGAIKASSIDVFRGRLDGATWNVEHVNGDISAEEDDIDVATARAVWSPKEWLERGKNVVAEGGHVVLHLASDAEAPAAGLVGVLASERGTIALVRV